MRKLLSLLIILTIAVNTASFSAHAVDGSREKPSTLETVGSVCKIVFYGVLLPFGYAWDKCKNSLKLGSTDSIPVEGIHDQNVNKVSANALPLSEIGRSEVDVENNGRAI